VVLGGAVAGLSAASSGKIAPGVTVGNVDVGGLTPTQARDTLEAQIGQAIQQPITVERRGKAYKLSAKEAKVDANIDALVTAAVEKSDQGNAFNVAWRTVSGEQTTTNIPVAVKADDDAVLRFVDRVRRGIDRQGVDAKLSFENDRPVVSKSTTGMVVDRVKLRKLVNKQLAATTRSATLLVPVKTAQPKVSATKLKAEHGTIIVVDRSKHTLRLFKKFKLAKTYSVAVGMQGLDTPAGIYTINDKQVDPSWHVPLSSWAGSLAGTVVPPGPSNPIKARWMGFFDGAGIHGTSDDASIGSNASHGCVRMHVSDVIDLYPRVPLGTTINVV
jgi:lipoprotein-anchoring transpeptidase ErfK/SrfK